MLSSFVCFFSAWQKEREELLNTVRTSENQAESVSALADSKLKEAQDLFDQARLIRSGADRDLIQALKSVQELQGRLASAQDQFRLLYEAVLPIISAVCRPEDTNQGLRGIMPVLSTRFFNFVRGGFRRCINEIVSFIRVATPEAPLERLVEPAVDAQFAQQWDVAKVELSNLTEQILDQMDVLPPAP